MNIGVDVRCLMDKQRTGVGEYAFGLLNAVFKVDRENRYFLFYNSYKDVSDILPKWGYLNVHYVGLKWPNKLFNVLSLLGVIKLDKIVSGRLREIGNWKLEIRNCLKIENCKLKIDVWYSPNLNFICLSKQVKFILTIHDLSFEFLPECYTFKQRLWHKLLRPKKQCQRADLILTPSENTKRDVVREFQISNFKFQILRPGTSLIPTLDADNLTQVKRKYDLPEKFVLFLGTIEPRKNVEAAILAYKNISSHITYHISHIIAGASGWKNEEVFRAIASTPNVRYIGYVAEEDKPALYQMASLFVYPSLYEGFGLPVLEAMACGAPVITSHRASLPEVGGDAVYYVNPANVAELGGAMKLILEDEDLRLKMVERQREQAKRFDWTKSAEEFIKIVCG